MKTLPSKKAQNGFGELIDTAQREPVVIQRRGRSVAVVMSFEEYERLEALQDALWGERAAKAEKEGFIGKKASEKVLSDILNAET